MESKGSVVERFAVIAICFGYLMLSSTWAVMAGLRTFTYADGDVAFATAFEITAALVALVLLRSRGWERGDIGFRVSRRATGGGALLFVAIYAAYALVYSALSAAGLFDSWGGVTVKNTASPLLLVLFVLVNSAFEEFFVTGYLVEAWSSSGVAMAISVSAAVRLLYHTYQGPLTLASIVPMGLIFGAVYWRWRNTWPLIVAHTILNFIYFAQA